jgi:uncharacterized protein (DUF2141 family)
MNLIRTLILVTVVMWAESLFAQGQNEGTAATGDLSVVISGYKTTRGKLKIALFNSEQDYQSNRSPLRSDSLSLEPHQSVVLFENIPHGHYAVKVYHDENNDGKLNTNFMGVPTERYGFSNNVRGTFGPASWSSALFGFAAARDSLSIVIR